MLEHSSSPNRLDVWCKQRSLPPVAVNFLSKLFTYDPDKRMTAREALSHGWFQEDPLPTYKFVLIIAWPFSSL
jgi:cyclin-dependent kinase 8/11